MNPLHVDQESSLQRAALQRLTCSVSEVDEFFPDPIDPEWILDGSPVARSVPLNATRDGQCWTALWDCTSGRFKWRYDLDETVYILEGEVQVTWPLDEQRTLGPGDIAFFAAGSEAEWYVPDYVKKIAFLRSEQSTIRSFLRRVPLLRKAVAAARKSLSRLRASVSTSTAPVL